MTQATLCSYFLLRVDIHPSAIFYLSDGAKLRVVWNYIYYDYDEQYTEIWAKRFMNGECDVCLVYLSFGIMQL